MTKAQLILALEGLPDDWPIKFSASPYNAEKIYRVLVLVAREEILLEGY